MSHLTRSLLLCALAFAAPLAACAPYPATQAGGLLAKALTPRQVRVTFAPPPAQAAQAATRPTPRRSLPPASARAAYALTGAATPTPSPWVASDIYEYRLSLQLKSGEAWVALDPALSTVIRANVPDAASSVSFSGIAGGQVYRLWLEAWGAPGGGAAATHLNAATPSAHTLDFTGPDADDTTDVTMGVVLDPVDSGPAGPATITLGTPSPGGFAAPSEAPTASARPLLD